MNLYLRDHHWYANAVAIMFVVVGTALVGNAEIRVGYSLSFGLPLSLVTPLLLAVILANSVVGSTAHLVSTSTIRVRAWLFGRLLGYLVIAASVYVASLAMWPASSPELPFLTIRNALGLIGLALLARHTLGRSWWWTVPVCYVLLCIVAGSDHVNTVQPWALLLDQEGAPTSTSVFLALFVSGVSLSICLGANREFAGPDPVTGIHAGDQPD